jgi:hypothetical protein
MSCSPEVVSWQDECIREEVEEAALTLVALSQSSVERKNEWGGECEFIQTTPTTYCVGLCRARGAPVAEHAFFLYPRGKKLSNRECDTHDCKVMCSNHAISPYQTSTVGIIRYVCLGHPASVERKDEGARINVEFIKHTKWRGGAPPGSKGRDLYCFSANGFQREADCWHWWRDDDNIVRILGGGGSRRPKQPTVYYFKVKGRKLSSCLDKDQSKAWDLYNQYGRK